MATEPERAPLSTDASRPETAGVPRAHQPLMHFSMLEQLKQRNVFRVAALYLVVCWLILEPVHVVFHMLDVPIWANRLVLILMAIGFPAAVIFAWVYEITPEGLKPTVEVPQGQSIRRLTGRRLDIAIIAVLAVALTYFVADKFWLSKRVSSTASTAVDSAPASPAVPEKSIAVLPFVDLSETHDQEYFADGMAEEIINLLVKVPELKVIGRTSSFQFKGKTDDLRKIGNTLGTAYVVEGSVRRSGGHVRITAQLIDARDGTHRWSQTYDRPPGDALQVQDEIAESLVRALQLEVTGLSHLQGRALPKNSEVYDAYLRGLHAVNQYNRPGYEEAVADFGRALELDPSFVPAAEELAYALAVQTDFGYVPLANGWAAARTASQKALDLDPRSALAHTVLGILHTRYDWDWPVAERELETAVELAPNNPIALLNLANKRMALGQWTEAMRLADAAIAIDPLDPQGHLTRAWAYMQLNRLAEAEHSFRRVVEIAPTFAFGHYFLGIGLLVQGKNEDALAEMLKETDTDGRNAGLAMAYHAVHRKQQADAALKDLETPSPGEEPWYFGVARAYLFRGQRDEVFKWLEKAYAKKGGDLWLIKGDPFFKSIGDDPRYKALLHKMNLPE